MQGIATEMHEYHGEFEVHITVNTPSAKALDEFREWCHARDLKCVRIILARGAHIDQPMATWRRRGTKLSVVVEEAEQRATEMHRAGFPVVRVKVEAGLGNDDVPLQDADTKGHRPGNYFEHHVKLLRSMIAPCEPLVRACETLGAHLSRNAFREAADGREERFVTLRSYEAGQFTSVMKLQELLAALEGLGEQVIACESEYCVYDTNLKVDAGWLCQLA